MYGCSDVENGRKNERICFSIYKQFIRLSDNDKSYHWGNFTDPSCFSDNHYLLLEIVVLSSLKRVHRFLSSSFAKRFVCNTDVLKTTSLLVQEFQLCFGPQLYCLPLHV